MKPVSPVIPGQHLPEVVIAENQPEYGNLPAVRMNNDVLLTRWHLSFTERLRVLFSGDLYVWLWTFGGPVQPLSIEVEQPVIPECEQGCDYQEPYGFVPMAGCPIHDANA